MVSCLFFIRLWRFYLGDVANSHLLLSWSHADTWERPSVTDLTLVQVTSFVDRPSFLRRCCSAKVHCTILPSFLYFHVCRRIWHIGAPQRISDVKSLKIFSFFKTQNEPIKILKILIHRMDVAHQCSSRERQPNPRQSQNTKHCLTTRLQVLYFALSKHHHRPSAISVAVDNCFLLG